MAWVQRSIFSSVSGGTSSISFTVSNNSASSYQAYVTVYLYQGSYPTPQTYGTVVAGRNGTVTGGSTWSGSFTGLSANTTYTIVLFEDGGAYECDRRVTGTGTASGGGGSSGSCSGSSTVEKTYTWSLNTTYQGSASDCWSLAPISLAGSGWNGYEWAWIKCTSVVETDYDITYTITQGARAKNEIDWPYRGLTITYTDSDNTTRTYLSVPTSSSGSNWSQGVDEGSYDFRVTSAWANNTITIKYIKSLSAAYTRQVNIDYFCDRAYAGSLGCCYKFNSIIHLTLSVPKRTKYIAAVKNGNGGNATVNNTTPEVYVNSGTSVTYRAVTNSGCTFKGWYDPTTVTPDTTYGYVIKSGATPVSTDETYSVSITADTLLVALFDGYRAAADWTNGRTYVKVSESWVLAQPYVRNGTTWTLADSYVG